MPYPFGALTGGTLAGRLFAPLGQCRIGIQFDLQGTHLLLSLTQTLFQCLAPPERSCTRTGTHTHAVLGYAIQIDQVLRHQRGDATREQVVEKFHMVGPKI